MRRRKSPAKRDGSRRRAGSRLEAATQRPLLCHDAARHRGWVAEFEVSPWSDVGAAQRVGLNGTLSPEGVPRRWLNRIP